MCRFLATVEFSFAFEATVNPIDGDLYFMRSAAYAARAKAQAVADYRKRAHHAPESWRFTRQRNVVLAPGARPNAYEQRTIDRCLAQSVQ